MSVNGWNERLLATTRGRILDLLLRQPRTVQELANELHITANTVRSHLATLERDRMVRQSGTVRRPGAGKPAHVFELVPDIETRCSKAYIPLLATLLDTLEDRIGSQELRGSWAMSVDGWHHNWRTAEIWRDDYGQQPLC